MAKNGCPDQPSDFLFEWILGHDPNKYRTSIPPCVHPGRPMLTHHLKTFGKSNT